jgi:hypothetical protein
VVSAILQAGAVNYCHLILIKGKAASSQPRSRSHRCIFPRANAKERLCANLFLLRSSRTGRCYFLMQTAIHQCKLVCWLWDPEAPPCAQGLQGKRGRPLRLAQSSRKVFVVLRSSTNSLELDRGPTRGRQVRIDGRRLPERLGRGAGGFWLQYTGRKARARASDLRMHPACVFFLPVVSAALVFTAVRPFHPLRILYSCSPLGVILPGPYG